MKRALKLIGIFIVCMLGIFFVGFTITSYIVMPIIVRSGKEVQVPDVCGLELEDAKKVLAEKRLLYELDIKRYYDGVPPGIVLSQRPAPGRIVKQDRRIFLTVSRGRERIGVPYLIGLDIGQANNILVSRDLFIGEIDYKHSLVEENIVIATSPPPASLLTSGDKVNLTLSRGPLSLIMPDLTGRSLEEVKEKLKELKLEIGDITYTSTSPLCNTVILQSPRVGENIKQGDFVNLIIGE